MKRLRFAVILTICSTIALACGSDDSDNPQVASGGSAGATNDGSTAPDTGHLNDASSGGGSAGQSGQGGGSGSSGSSAIDGGRDAVAVLDVGNEAALDAKTNAVDATAEVGSDGNAVDGPSGDSAVDAMVDSGAADGGVVDSTSPDAATPIDAPNDSASDAGSPSVVSTTPLDATLGVPFWSKISIAFNVPMNPATLVAQTSSGPCSGSVQASTDNFVTCIGFAAAAPVMSGGNSVGTFTPAPALSFGSTYRIKVAAAAQDPQGNASVAYVSPVGFTTTAPTTLCITGNVVISQVYGGGGNAGASHTNDFIELYNRASVPVDLSGWSVQYASAASTFTGATNLVGTIPPGGYYLVQEASGGAVGAALPTPDATGIINMSSTTGKVALANKTTLLTACNDPAVIDLVGYGATANCFEGVAATAAPSNSTSVRRGDAGCRDTEVNTDDFVVGLPTPRNSATAMTLCACGDQTLNESNSVLEADYCVIQFPTSLTVQKGVSTGNIFGRIFELGLTEAAGPPSNWDVEVGYGPEGVNPENELGWTWFGASYNNQFGNDDEYLDEFIANPPAGQYRYAYRFSNGSFFNGGVGWTYCDLDGAGSNSGLSFEVTRLPILTYSP